MTRSGVPLVARGLTKHFGDVTAVDDLTFTAEPGRITAFLGPNGAGKTTTLRMFVGLVRPTSGQALVGDQPYRALPQPVRTVGAALESSGFHPGRSALDHLRVLADAAGLPLQRADELLGLVGLTDSARRRVGGYSLGMRQRLSLASALLGDPAVLVLDEPANGLDPEGIAWLRQHLRWLADTGRTVVVSSHQLAEVAQTADDVVIVSRGRLVQDGPLSAVLALAGEHVRVRTPDASRLVTALEAAGHAVATDPDGSLLVSGVSAAEVGDCAHRAGVALHELRPVRADLEQVFLDLVDGPPGVRDR